MLSPPPLRGKMPQAHAVFIEKQPFYWDLISDRQPKARTGGYHGGYARDRTHSLPTNPHAIIVRDGERGDQRGQPRRRQGDEADPLTRMRSNLERTTFLLSKMRMELSKEPEEIIVLPPKTISRHHSEPTRQHSPTSLEHSSHPPPKPKGRVERSYHATPALQRSDSLATNASSGTQFSLDVSTYSRSGAERCEDEPHGSEFHRIINHGLLYNPARATAVLPKRPHPLAQSQQLSNRRHSVVERPKSPAVVGGRHELPSGKQRGFHVHERSPLSPLNARSGDDGDVKIASRPFPPSAVENNRPRHHGQSAEARSTQRPDDAPLRAKEPSQNRRVRFGS